MIIILGLTFLTAAVVAVVCVLDTSGGARPLTATIDQTPLACGPAGRSATGAGMPGERAHR
jgi:hypothetical protein